jgi:hypothetical protein
MSDEYTWRTYLKAGLAIIAFLVVGSALGLLVDMLFGPL